MRLKYIVAALLGVSVQFGALADTKAATATESNTIEIPPLFEYPVAPDSISTLGERADWLMEHFWDGFDFTMKRPLGQLQLNHAFEVYSTPMRFAQPETVNRSVDKLIKNIQKNPTLLYQFSKAAEDCLYSPTASVWIDDVYMKFIEPASKNKKVPESRRKRYAGQLRRIRNSLIGNKLPAFPLTMRDSTNTKFAAPSKITILEFANPDCVDCIMARAQLDNNSDLKALRDAGKVQLYFVWADPEAGNDWTKSVKNYSDSWIVARADGISDMLDFRFTPSLYLLDADGRIVLKNATLPDVIAAAREMCAGEPEINLPEDTSGE